MPFDLLFYQRLPLWVLSLSFFAGLVIAREAGRLLRRRLTARRGVTLDDDSFAMSSVLGLLALLIGFTFSIALQRYEDRRELVIAEANALGTTWLRTQLFDEAPQQKMQSALRRYVDNRVAFGQAKGADEERRLYRQSETLQTELWKTVVEAVAPFRTTPLAGLMITTTNESIDLAATRMATRQAHIPGRIVWMLTLFAMVSAGMLGYHQGHRRTATTLMLFLITLAVALVMDLDKPTSGMVSVPQTPMLDLQRSLQP